MADSKPKMLDPPSVSPIEEEKETSKKTKLPSLETTSKDAHSTKTGSGPAPPPISPPLSTGSSTSTLKEGDSSESISALKEDTGKTKAAKEKVDVTDRGIEKEARSTSPKLRKSDDNDYTSSTRYKYTTSRYSSDSYTSRKSVSPASSFKSKTSSSATTVTTSQSDVCKPKLESKSDDNIEKTTTTYALKKSGPAAAEKEHASRGSGSRSPRDTCLSPTKMQEQRPSSRSSNSDNETVSKRRIGSSSSDKTPTTPVDSKCIL